MKLTVVFFSDFESKHEHTTSYEELDNILFKESPEGGRPFDLKFIKERVRALRLFFPHLKKMRCHIYTSSGFNKAKRKTTLETSEDENHTQNE